ncbi:MAG TPA: hypothetical protein VGX16_00645, partial [Solirubrobacteraceae bacterium]|nr:hypothetical protein [Solirubrobacteraceae bacterium]
AFLIDAFLVPDSSRLPATFQNGSSVSAPHAVEDMNAPTPINTASNTGTNNLNLPVIYLISLLDRWS